jgi:intracellular sulfur oxidation DsrE/DsrF family protein
MKVPITDETVNAFVDQQLTPGEMEEVFEAVRQDAELAQRICAVRQLKSMVKHAYDGIEPSRPAQWSAAHSRGIQALAAALLLGLGGLIGWSLHPSAGNILPAALAQGGEVMHASLHGELKDNRIILHLDSDKPERMAAVLDYADQILDNARKQGVDAKLEIVANSYGLNLLRAGYTPYLDRINALAKKHANLSFIACGQTVARFKREGQEVTLIKQARVAPSAIGEVVSKLKAGWTYIRV